MCPKVAASKNVSDNWAQSKYNINIGGIEVVLLVSNDVLWKCYLLCSHLM
jgi:hypothetical protein